MTVLSFPRQGPVSGSFTSWKGPGNDVLLGDEGDGFLSIPKELNQALQRTHPWNSAT